MATETKEEVGKVLPDRLRASECGEYKMNTCTRLKTGPWSWKCVRCLDYLLKGVFENDVNDNENEKGGRKEQRYMCTGHAHVRLGCQRHEVIGVN